MLRARSWVGGLSVKKGNVKSKNPEQDSSAAQSTAEPVQATPSALIPSSILFPAGGGSRVRLSPPSLSSPSA